MIEHGGQQLDRDEHGQRRPSGRRLADRVGAANCDVRGEARSGADDQRHPRHPSGRPPGSGATAYLDADLRETTRILKEAADTLDLTQPVGIMMIAVLHCIPDEDEPGAIVSSLLEAVPPGSYLALSHPAIDIHSGVRKAAPRMNQLLKARLTFRTRDQVTALFDGLELVEPGVVRVPDWRPATEAEAANPAAVWGGVGRKI